MTSQAIRVVEFMPLRHLIRRNSCRWRRYWSETRRRFRGKFSSASEFINQQAIEDRDAAISIDQAANIAEVTSAARHDRDVLLPSNFIRNRGRRGNALSISSP